MFQNAAIPIFTNFNLLLQRDEPCIHLLKPSIENFGRRIANRIIKPHAMQNISTVSELDFGDEFIFKDKKDLFLGGTTKATLNCLLSYGDISDTNYDKFYDAVFYYYKDSLAYLIKKFPIQNELVCNAVWVDVEKRLDATWHNVQYFLDRFSYVKSLEFVNVDTLYEEFVDYQTLSESELEEGFEKGKVTDGIVNEKDVFHYRIDVDCWHLANLNTPGTSVKRFHNLAKIAEIVLVIPHSNAEQERLFSIVRKNKSDSRSKLAVGGSLSSILTVNYIIQSQLHPVISSNQMQNC